MNVSGHYLSGYLNGHNRLMLSFDFYYAGDTPFAVGGVDYRAGTRLFSFSVANADEASDYTWALGPFFGTSLSTGIAGFSSSVTSNGAIVSDVDAILEPDPGYHGRKYVVPGQAQWSGSVYGSYAPESASWWLMLVGFGLAGAATRRRQVRMARRRAA